MNSDERGFLFETTHWKVILMDDQLYLGRSVVVLKRPCGDLAEVTNDEIIDFLALVRQYERLLRVVFGATMFNWACLMNNAYQETPAKPQVHWHVRPRYAAPVHFAGEVFEDPNFGHHYLREDGNRRILSPELLGSIAAGLKSAQV